MIWQTSYAQGDTNVLATLNDNYTWTYDFFDTTGAQLWSVWQADYTSGSQLSDTYDWFRDGAQFAQFYDPGSGQLQEAVQWNPDRTSFAHVFNWNGQPGNWTDYYGFWNAQGQTIGQVAGFSDGSTTQIVYDLNTKTPVFEVLQSRDGAIVSTRFDVSGQQVWSQQTLAVSGDGQHVLLTENYRGGNTAAFAFDGQGNFVSGAGQWAQAANDGSFASIDVANVNGSGMNVDFVSAPGATAAASSGEIQIAQNDLGDVGISGLNYVGVGTNGSLAGNGALGAPGAAAANFQNNAAVQAGFRDLLNPSSSATPSQPSQPQTDPYAGFGSGDVIGGIQHGDFTVQLPGSPF